MAVVLDSLVATFSRTVFIKPPDAVRGYTAMPRAIVNFNILDGVVSIKPLNDTQELIIGVDLPSNLAYRFLDFAWNVIQDEANQWRPVGYMELTNAVRGLVPGATQRHPIVIQDTTRIPVPTEMWIAEGSRSGPPGGMPRYVIQTNPRGSPASPVITFKAMNDTAAAAIAGTTNFYASFLEFDIEQVEAFPIHWPANTYSR